MAEKLPHARRLPPRRPGQSFAGSQDLTHQSFKDECDINKIIQRHNVSGPAPVTGSPRTPMWGDFSSAPDFMEAQNLIISARERFAALPVKVRDRFNHDPLQLLRFVGDPANLREAAALGLLSPEAVARLNAPPPAAPPAPESK